jgi:hypothetical protein
MNVYRLVDDGLDHLDISGRLHAFTVLLDCHARYCSPVVLLMSSGEAR